MAVHFEQAKVFIQASSYFYRSGMALIQLGLQERGHKHLISSFRMFEKALKDNANKGVCVGVGMGASVGVGVGMGVGHMRHQLNTLKIMNMIGAKVGGAYMGITAEHLERMFEGK